MTKIPYGRQTIQASDIEAVMQVLKSDWITQGPAIEHFEQKLAKRFESPHALAVCNATAALHLAYLAAGLGPGKKLWTSPNTFLATANAARFCGADVDFVDIDPKSWNLSVEQLVLRLSQAEKTGQLPDVLAPVHFGGNPCEMEAIAGLARKYNFQVVEDASHAVGARYQNHPIGSSHYSDFTVFSFHPVKIITTGEGGAILTHNTAAYERMARLRSHGMTRNPKLMQQEGEGGWYYEQLELGFNYRITDIQAALGESQLERLDSFIQQRQVLAKRYSELLADLSADLALQLPSVSAEAVSAWHLYVIRIPSRKGMRKQVYDHLQKAGIEVNVHYIPVHLQPYYRQLGFKPGDFPEAEAYYREAITLPLFPTLTLKQQDFIVSTLKEALH